MCKHVTIVAATCAACLIYSLAAVRAEAQVLRPRQRAANEAVRQQPIAPGVVAAPAPEARQPDNRSYTAGQGDRRDVGDRPEAGRIIRGSELLGMQVWDSDRQSLGTIKDFIVDYSGDCPTLYFAMSSDVLSGDGYVVLPWDAVRLRFDDRGRRDYIFLGMRRDQLRDVPRLRGDNWDVFRDRNFVDRTRQFFSRVERTAARPIAEPERTGANPRPGDRRDSGAQPGGDQNRERHDLGPSGKKGPTNPELNNPGSSAPGRNPGAPSRPDAGVQRNPGTPEPSEPGPNTGGHSGGDSHSGGSAGRR